MRSLAIAVALLSGSAVAQEPRASVGVLTCTLMKEATAPPGEMSCGFKPTRLGKEEKFTGSVRGIPHADRAKVVLVWAVLGPAEGNVSGAMLAQRYMREQNPSADPPTWRGESHPEITLQFETNNAANPDASITEIELKLAGTAA